MSQENSRTPKVTSNEEVIHELTKGLESSMISKENSEEHEEFVISPGTSHGDLPTSASQETKPEVPNVKSYDLDKEFDESDKESEKEDSDSDSIDEEALKDGELDLTDDMKAERKIIAEELKNAGNIAFKNEEFERSIEKYTEGLRICPLQFSTHRAILYSNRSAAKMKLKKYKRAITDCTKAIELDDGYVKAYIRRAQCYETTDKLDEALADYQKILEFDPSHRESRIAVTRLPPLINEKNEKLKTEMLGKLKDLGNIILKPFGLSTENFKLEQDPESKGYKINFQQ